MIWPSIATMDSPVVAGDANRGIRYTRSGPAPEPVPESFPRTYLTGIPFDEYS